MFKDKMGEVIAKAEKIRNKNNNLSSLNVVLPKHKPLIDIEGTLKLTEWFTVGTKQKFLSEVNEGKQIKKIEIINVKISDEDVGDIFKIAKQRGLEEISLK